VKEYVIQPQEGKSGRSFVAACAAHVVATGLWDGGYSDSNIRPIWAMFAGSDNELRPFMANLRLGRKAEPLGSYRRSSVGERFEFLRSTGFYMSWQREAEGSLVTMYHPELFRLDPGMVDPSGARFVLLVPTVWAESQQLDDAPALRHMSRFEQKLEPAALKALVPVAYLFAAYLDRRTRCPLIASGAFYLQLLCAALDAKLASLPGNNTRYTPHYSEWGRNGQHGFAAEGLEDVGISHAISFSASHEALEAFLAEQVSLFFEVSEMTKPKLARKRLISEQAVRI
jgi:hypothetical protein